MVAEDRQAQRDAGLIRSGGVSELSEKNGYVEASHLDHNKRDIEVYLSPETVVMCTPVEHYAYHLMFEGKAHLIGLSENHNNYAIRQCYDRAVFYLHKHHQIYLPGLDEEEQQKIIAQAWNYWSYYMELPFYEES